MTFQLDNPFLKTPEKKEGTGELLKVDVQDVKTRDLVKKISDSDTLPVDVFDELKKLSEESLDALLIKLPLAKRFKVEMQIMPQKRFFDTIKMHAQKGELNPARYTAQIGELPQMSGEVQGQINRTNDNVNGLGLTGDKEVLYRKSLAEATGDTIDSFGLYQKLADTMGRIPNEVRARFKKGESSTLS